MKRNLYFILFVLFILSACVPPAASLQAATAAQESMVIPTDPLKPTVTPMPVVRFAVLLPENYVSCKNNLLNPDGTIEGAYKGLEELLQYEQSMNIDPNNVSIWNNMKLQPGDWEMAKAPFSNSIKININPEYNLKASLASCSYMQLANDEFYVFGVPFRIKYYENNDEITFLHFAVNFKAAENMYRNYDKSGYDGFYWRGTSKSSVDFYNKYVDINRTYPKLSKSNFNEASFSMIGGMSLESYDYTLDNVWNSTFQLVEYIIQKKFWTLIKENKTSTEIQKIIIPCTDIRVDPTY